MKGAIVTQTAKGIKIEGTGNGKLLLQNGDGGILIKSNGDVKLFGKTVALNPNSKVTLKGDVEYKVGPKNKKEKGKKAKLPKFSKKDLLDARNQPLQYDELARDRDTQAEDPAAKEAASVLIKDEQGNPQSSVRLLITLPDGNEMLVQTDEEGRVNLQKDNLSGASVRVLGKTVAPANGGEA